LLEVNYTTKFKKDFKKQKVKLSFEDLYIFYQVIEKLRNRIALEPKFSDHPLEGEYGNCRDCHIKPDLVLIYYIDDESDQLVLMRLNSHSELFS